MNMLVLLVVCVSEVIIGKELTQHSDIVAIKRNLLGYFACSVSFPGLFVRRPVE